MPQIFYDPKDMKQDFAFLAKRGRNVEEYLHAAQNGYELKDTKLVIPVGCRFIRYDENDSGFKLALLLDSEQSVLYYCNIVKVTDEELNIAGVTQSLVWRNRMKPAYKRATQDFVGQVFDHYLIENYTVIISDVYHSFGGMFMWQEQLGYAIEREDRNVYLYDQLSCIKTQIDKSNFDEFLDSLWSEDESKLHHRAVIEKK
ncbi:hypothetical protein L3Q72_01045 [Vibrio sp. JC009]|uniref:hypothetical protein n=1 Tax=Vibrio sp. JC009 TaxID=2912314 RepID=UPI0023B19B3D|nr:hypothetical protein [Vibrio sp. JC009]WED22034.1 hypothetical protein L3Q72_01045 [Vibrio sp. JC009]